MTLASVHVLPHAPVRAGSIISRHDRHILVCVSDAHYVLTGPDYKFSIGWLRAQLPTNVEWGTRVVAGAGFILDIIALG